MAVSESATDSETYVLSNSVSQGTARFLESLTVASTEHLRPIVKSSWDTVLQHFFCPLALATGTLLYVSLFEIIQRERSKKCVPGIFQLFFIILGFSLMMMADLLGKNLSCVQ